MSGFLDIGFIDFSLHTLHLFRWMGEIAPFVGFAYMHEAGF